MTRKTRAAKLSVASNALLTLLKLAVGLAMGSVSVMSEAVHSGIDLLAAMIAWLSLRVAVQPADECHRYGHGKYESVSGTAEALLIFVAAGWILYESVAKLLHGGVSVERLGIGAAVMALSAVVNFAVSKYLMRVARETDSLALEADALHLRTDVYTSIGVLLGIAAIRLTGLQWLDPAVAIAVALLIIKASWDLTRHALGHLLDASLSAEDESVITAALAESVGKYVEFHKVRTRKSGAQRYIDLHLVVPGWSSVRGAHDLAHRIAGKIEAQLMGSHVLIHTEPCSDQCGGCSMDCDTETLRLPPSRPR